jgi:hypothetical protein
MVLLTTWFRSSPQRSLSTLCLLDGGSHQHPMVIRAGLIGSKEVRAEQQRDQQQSSRVPMVIAYGDFGVCCILDIG